MNIDYKELLNKKGPAVSLNTKRFKGYKPNCFMSYITRKESFTLKQAIERVLLDSKFHNCKVKIGPELVKDLYRYKNSEYGITNVLNKKYNFDSSCKTRFVLNAFIRGLYEYGWDFMSDKLARSFNSK